MSRLRSAGWFEATGKNGILHRSWMRSEGLPDDTFAGRPVIGIANSWSELTPCNAHLRELAEHVKRGVWQAGGVPLEFPTMSIGETMVRPSSLMLRNLMAMDLEETVRANPLDGVILLAGCDKTTPAYLMGAASTDLPSLLITGGPMLNGRWRGQTVGSGTSVWQLSDQHRLGQLTDQDLSEAESCMARSRGHCMTMGTASTMALLTEVLGMQLPGSAELPADDARRRTNAHLAGRRIVELVHEDLRPSAILTREAFENAIRVNAAIGGSTNAVVHLLALARRVGVPLELDDFDTLARDVPTLVDAMPSGRFLMEDFVYAGGIGAVVEQLGDLLHHKAIGVSGRTFAEAYAGSPRWDERVIRSLTEPFKAAGTGTAVLRGNLAPRGAVIKQSAATADLMVHRGRARVWDDYEAYLRDADDPDLDVRPDDVLVLRGAGPVGYPGMPEIANLPLPTRMLAQGVSDMVRVSDARMSGTSYGTIVLHVCPESVVGGPLAALRDGDTIVLDVPGRSLDVELTEAEIAERLRAAPPVGARPQRGYQRLYVDHVLQADDGADLDFLVGHEPAGLPRRSQ